MNNEPMFELFGLQVTPYALSVALALVMGIAALALVCRRDGLKGGTAALCAAFCLLLGPRAARLGYCLVRIRHYLEIGLENVLRPGEGEFMLLGAVAGCALAGWLTARLTRQKTGSVLDAMAAPAALTIALCRFAEYLSGDGYGLDVLDETFMRFPFAVVNEYEEWYWAIFVLEGLWALMMLVILLTSRRTGGEKAKLFLILYCAAQITLEGLRRDEYLRLIFFIRVAQLLSALVIAGLMIAATVRWAKKQHNPGMGRTGIIVCWAVALLCAGAVIALEFAADGKILTWMPVWAIYLVMALCSVAFGIAAGRMVLSRGNRLTKQAPAC